MCNVNELKGINEIYASNSSRAIETAKYLAESNNLKIKLDKRINERKFGIDYLSELPKDFTKNSFENKDLKIKDGESLNELDTRFKSFINDLLNNDSNKIAIVMHGIILLPYLKTICDTFTFDGKIFCIRYKDNIILNGTPKNPSVYKIEFDNSKVINIENIKLD